MSKPAQVHCSDTANLPSSSSTITSIHQSSYTGRRLLLLMWAAAGLLPWLLQVRSYIQLMTPHKITQDLLAPDSEQINTDVTTHCSLQGLHIAGSWWNVAPTHYYDTERSTLCHFVIPQYNIHGAYRLQNTTVAADSMAPTSCANDSHSMDYYFYHGSIGYYSFYEEGDGTYCDHDKTAYATVQGLGSSDINGGILANFEGPGGYRKSYYYGCVGLVWIVYRAIVLRRSYISCSRFGRRCDTMCERLFMSNAAVFVQESSRISAHGARNIQRLGLIYLLVEGLMGDLFLLIAKDGFFAKVQYISLGYNLSGVLSLLFEMLENMNWLRPPKQLFVKRLLFNIETAFWGELLCATTMQYYLTALNRSSLRDSAGTAEAVSHYVWSVVGHGIIVLGLTSFILTIRAVGAIAFVGYQFRSLRLFTEPCCVDSTMGVRHKVVTLSGYIWNNSKLYYAHKTLKSFGLLKMANPSGQEFLVYHKTNWLAASREKLLVVGTLTNLHVEPCAERPCSGVVTVCDRMLGGSTGDSETDSHAVDSLDALENARFLEASLGFNSFSTGN